MPFSEKTLDFLIENRLHDDRSWYHEHKAQYTEYVLQPMRELVEALTPLMQRIDDQLICEPKVDRTISRIYRDTRFSKDKSLYRDHMWCTFMRDKKVYHGLPGFYFEITPQGFSCGCGYYQADTKTMEAMRELILAKDAAFTKARRALEKQDVFYIEGELYKRSKYPGADEKLRSWLDRKTICISHDSQDFALLFSDRLAPWLTERLAQLEAVYKFFCKAESRKIKG